MKKLFNNNKIGKNDIIDVGSYKNLKLKNIFKNSNVNLDNLGEFERIALIISEKELENIKYIQKIRKCNTCINNLNNFIAKIDKQKQGICEKYDYSEQIKKYGYIKFDYNELIVELSSKKRLANQLFYNICCDKHKSVFDKIERNRTIVKSLRNTLKLSKVNK